jgi:integrase
MSLKLEAVTSGSTKESVLLRYAYSRKSRKYFSTGVTIPVKDFNRASIERPVRSSNPQSKHFNRLIEEVYNRIMTIIQRLRSEDKEPTADLVHRHYHSLKEAAPAEINDPSLTEAFANFLQARRYPQSTEKLYNSTLKNLQDCFGDVRISEIDLAFWSKFRTFLEVTKKRSANTVNIRLAKLKCFLKYVRKSGYIFELASFPMPKEEVKKVCLDRESLEALRSFSSSNKSISLIRDICLFQCFTGLRISDLKRLSRLHIRQSDGYAQIVMKSYKTNRPMTIPLTPEAFEILSRYDFQLPIPVEQYYNRQLKTLIKLAGIDEEIEWQAYDTNGVKYQKSCSLSKVFSNHCCSRTAIAYFLDAGFPMAQVASIVGKSLDTIMKYYYGRTSSNEIINRQKSLFQVKVAA